jgi:hypothetical protein
MSANPITEALQANVTRAKSKAGRKFAEEQLAQWLERKERKPLRCSPFSRFVERLESVPDNPRP